MILEHDWLPIDVPDRVSLGDKSFLYSVYAFQHARLDRSGSVTVGPHTAVYTGTMFDIGPCGSVQIGKYCLVNGPHFAVNSRVVIGDYAHISSETFFTDTDAPVPPIDRAYAPARTTADPSIVVGDDCWIGLRCVIRAGTRLGNGVIVGAGSVVRGDFPDLAIVGGNPATQRGWARP